MIGSMSVSNSISDDTDCCSNACNPCETWLAAFCDYVPLAVDSCGEKTAFTKARQHSIKITATNPMAGIHPMDKIFELSMLEHDIHLMPGAKITDAAGLVWTVYAVEDNSVFCLTKAWARSVAVCFGLIGGIDVLVQNCDCDDSCDAEQRFIRVSHVKGNILASSATTTTQHDATNMVYRYTCELEAWPLSTLPDTTHRLKHNGRVYRITRVNDRGGLVPLSLDLEVDHGSCC